jgi:hypothetical protein
VLQAYKLFYSTWRYRALLQSFTVQGRCIGAETRALFAATLWCHGYQLIMTQNRARWRAASSEAFALYVIVAGFVRAPKTFPKRAHRRACSRLVRIMHPTILSRRYAHAKSVQSPYLTLPGCVLLSQGGPGLRLRAEAAAYATLA